MYYILWTGWCVYTYTTDEDHAHELWLNMWLDGLEPHLEAIS